MPAAVETGKITLGRFLALEQQKELLRFTTAGSVDDGKSTLIGRLLHDCRAIYEDQLASVKKSRINRSGKAIDFSLLTDGLRAEREQGITIDVAYRYFSTARRKFIIADTPGHEQYTRNMATGASTADLAVILVDASKGILPQTRRHAYIASLLGISHVLAAVNKMDVTGYREDVFSRIREDFFALAGRLGIADVRCIPVSALEGDNVVTRGENMPWYSGPTLLEHLETVSICNSAEMRALRFPIQIAIRPDARFRGFAGRIAAGSVRPGDEVLALPSRQRARVESITTFDGALESASASQSVTLTLTDEIDLSRGDMLVSPDLPPQVSSRFNAMVVWLHVEPLELNRVYLVKHAGRYVKARATRLRFRVDINTLADCSAETLEMNGIGSVEFESTQPLYFDAYAANRITGSLILIDPLTNATVGAAMICEPLPDTTESARAAAVFERSHTAAPEDKVMLEERIARRRHWPAIFSVCWSRANAEALERALFHRGFDTVLLAVDEIPVAARHAFFSILWNLGFVILAWSGSRSVEGEIQSRDRELFQALAGESYFDLAGEKLRDGDAQLDRAVRIAETLRDESGSTKARED